MLTLKEQEAKYWTYNDYLQLDDETRYEVGNGKLIMTPSPNLNHQRICRELEFVLCRFIKENNLGEVFFAPTDVVLDSANIVQPDIVVVMNNNKDILQEKAIFGVPDLVVEILSPTSYSRDRKEKHQLYERFQIPEYWIVDPDNQSILVYALENQKYQLLMSGSNKEMVESNVLGGFKVKVKNIFAG